MTRPTARHTPPSQLIAGLAIVVAFVAGACSVGERPQLVAVGPTATAVPTATPTPIPEPTAAPEPTEPAPTPEPAQPVWQVVDAVNNLNLRSDPTTSAEILANFGPGDSGLIGTGQTATSDGFDWIELAADQGRPSGWVAAKFLTPDESVAPRVCFNSADGDGTTTIVLDFSADADTFTGGVRTVTSDELEYDAVAGRRTDGTIFVVTVQSVPGGAERTEEWVSGPGGMAIADDDSVDAANCADIAEFVMSIDTSVTSYPDVPS